MWLLISQLVLKFLSQWLHWIGGYWPVCCNSGSIRPQRRERHQHCLLCLHSSATHIVASSVQCTGWSKKTVTFDFSLTELKINISKPPYVPFPRIIDLYNVFLIFRYVRENIKVAVSLDHPVLLRLSFASEPDLHCRLSQSDQREDKKALPAIEAELLHQLGIANTVVSTATLLDCYIATLLHCYIATLLHCLQ